MFSPITWMQSVTTASTVSPSISAAMRGLDVGGLRCDGSLGDLLGVSLELLVHADEVGLAVELDDGADGAVVGDERHDGALVGGTAGLLGDGGETARAQTSTAFSRSPSASASAFLHSIMPAPVISRSSLTIDAVMLAMVYSFPWNEFTDGGACEHAPK